MVYLLCGLVLFSLVGILPPAFWDRTKQFFSFINDFCNGIKNIFTMFASAIQGIYGFLVSPFRSLGNFLLALRNTSAVIEAQQQKEKEKLKDEDVNLKEEIGQIWISVKTGTLEEKEKAKQRLAMLMKKHGEAKINEFLKEAQNM